MKRLSLLIIVMLLLLCGCSKETKVLESIGLANKYLAEQNYQEAILAFKEVIRIDPKSLEGYKGLALAFEAVGDITAVEMTLLDGIVQVEDKDTLRTQLAEFYIFQGDIVKADTLISQITDKSRAEKIRAKLDALIANSSEGNTSGNMMNGGTIAPDNGWTYIGGRGIIRTDDSTGVKEVVFETERYCGGINVVNDRVVFVNQVRSADGNYRYDIVSLDLSTGQATTIEQDIMNNFICYNGGFVYYIKASGSNPYSGNLYCIDVNGKGKRQVTPTLFSVPSDGWDPFIINMFYVSDGRVYYIDTVGDGTFKSIDIHGENPLVHYSDGFVLSFLIKDGFLYLAATTDYTGVDFVRIGIIDNRAVRLSSISGEIVGNLNVTDDALVYSIINRAPGGNTASLHRVGLDGTGAGLLDRGDVLQPFGEHTEFLPPSVQVSNGWIYYTRNNEPFRIRYDGSDASRYDW